MSAAWCSCDKLRKAEEERDRYRNVACDLVCGRINKTCGAECATHGGSEPNGYCKTVTEEVDSDENT